MKASEILILNKQGTKKQVKKAIKAGNVIYNGQTLAEDIEVEEGLLTCEGHVMDLHPLKYYMLNKPTGYICDAKSTKYIPVDTLLPAKQLHYVGRLDQNTTGLLLVTNDLKLRKKLILPSYHVEKTYAFSCLYPLTQEDLNFFEEGIIIDHQVRCQSAQVILSDATHGTITIHEGKYHEIRKMFLSLDNQIVTLKRIAFGPLSLGFLPEGDYRPLTQEEIMALKEVVS